MNPRKKIMFFRNAFQEHSVWQIPSKSYGWVYLIYEKGHITLTNSYGGKMNGYLMVAIHWDKWWKRGVRWIYKNETPAIAPNY